MALGIMGISSPALPGWADRLAGGPPGLDVIWAGAKNRLRKKLIYLKGTALRPYITTLK
jgi:hypothetical protein